MSGVGEGLIRPSIHPSSRLDIPRLPSRKTEGALMNVSSNPIPLLRKVALAEGVSFLVLLGIAMPLKYLAKIPVAVLIAGSVHGALFLLLCFLLWRTMRLARWEVKRAAIVFIAALLPGGPFFLDRRLRAHEAEYRPA